MKKIIILSDTHKNQKILRNVFKLENEYTHIIHLGDDFEDINKSLNFTKNIVLIRVSGLYYPGYKDGTVPAILEIEIDKWKFALAHRLDDLLKTSINADFYLYGHTHHSNYDNIKNKHFINPGHLKAKIDRGQKASYVFMTINKNIVDIQFKHLDGKVFKNKIINKL